MARFMERFEEHMEADPALREEYERLEPRFRAISALIKARGDISQSELARRMQVSPGVISRLESAQHDPRLGTLTSAATRARLRPGDQLPPTRPRRRRIAIAPDCCRTRTHSAACAAMLASIRRSGRPISTVAIASSGSAAITITPTS